MIEFLAEHLNMEDTSCVKWYTERQMTAYEHYVAGSRPRFRDLADQRFWRADVPGVATGGYGPLELMARNRVNMNKVVTHWPDMLRVASSLVTGQVRAYDRLRRFGRGEADAAGAGVRRVRADRHTLHLLCVVNSVDDSYRRQMNGQLTVQESRHKPAGEICHGKRGQIMQAYREGQEDQLGALGLVLNAAVLWTTRYLDAAVEQLRALPADQREHGVLDEDVGRLSPLRHANLNGLAATASCPQPRPAKTCDRRATRTRPNLTRMKALRHELGGTGEHRP
ncbi:Tn3 family transposase [Streptomyces sp. NPDC002004]